MNAKTESTQTKILDAFVPYWGCYAEETEANNLDKTGWQPATMNKGIIPMAIKSIAEHLSGQHGAIPREILKGIWGLDSVIHYNDIRVSILGSCCDSNVQARFLQEIKELSRESLCFCVVPQAKFSVWPLIQQEPQNGAALAIPLYPVDIDALALQKVGILNLVDYKLYRRLILNKPDPDTRFQLHFFNELRDSRTKYPNSFQVLQDAMVERLDDPKNLVPHPLHLRVLNAIQNHRGCLLSGPSSSGKSILAMQVGQALSYTSAEVLYVNLSNLSFPPSDTLIKFWAPEAEGREVLFILDDLQSNPAISRYLLSVSNASRRIRITSPPAVIALSWNDYAAEAATWHENCLPLPVQPHQVAPKLIEQYARDGAPHELKDSGRHLEEDLLLLRLWLEQSKTLGRSGSVTLSELASSLWQRRAPAKGDRHAVKRLALVAGSLGRYDIPTPKQFLLREARVEKDLLEACLNSHLVRRQGESITMGHRSLCGLLCDWLGSEGAWKELADAGGPADSSSVVLDYLGSLGSSLAVDLLRALQARAGFKKAPQLNRRAAAVVEIWQTFNDLVEKIERQQFQDATWGKVPSSAVFAIQAFAELGKPALAERSIEFLRQCWSVQDGKLIIDIRGLATNADFEKIRFAMQKEDERHEVGERNWCRAEDIDINEFHSTWLMGLILTAEARAPKPRLDLQLLAQLAEAKRQAFGGFYPSRVPWVTARVLIGLVDCGRTIDTSLVVKQACDWLLRDHRDGGAFKDGLWESGTGTWNTVLETTGMVLLALAAVGHECSSEKLQSARNYLLEKREDWTLGGQELAGALAVQAYLATGGLWEDVAGEVQRLSRWARSEDFWNSVTENTAESLEQSCRVAQIAFHLISIGWWAVRSDLHAFLDALAIESVSQRDLKSQNNLVPAAAPQASGTATREEPETSSETIIVDCLRALSRVSLTECRVVGAYCRYDERARNELRDLKQRIASPLLAKSNKRENFLIWAAPGSGKSFLIQEIAQELRADIDYFELNLARDKREIFISALGRVRSSKRPTLCLIDEVDALAQESWPYEEFFSMLDLNTAGVVPFVFVLIGSHPTGMEALIRSIEVRNKGGDLLSRIFAHNRVKIRSATLEDRVIVIASQIMAASQARSRMIIEIEKLALFYALANGELQSPRQLRDLIVGAVARVSPNETRLKYDDLFEVGDRRNQRFWTDHQEAVRDLSDVFVRIES